MVATQQPRVAIVRKLSLARQAHSSLHRLPQADDAARRPNTTGGSGSLYSYDRPPLGFTRLPADCFEEKDETFEDDVYLRPLSRREMAQKRASAVQYFRQARDINRRSQSVGAIVSSVGKARQEKDNQAKPRESVTVRQLSSCKQHEHPPLEEVSSVNVSPLVGEQNAENQQKSRDPESSPPPVRKTLAEQFGYGIVRREAKPTVALASPAPVDEKANGFVRVEAGTTDLLQRLAAKKQSSLAAACA